MKWVAKTKFNSIDEAVKNPHSCRVLNLLLVRKNFTDFGSSLAKLKNLRELYIQGDSSIYDDFGFSLPIEIGELKGLEKLWLLNLPLKNFPDWVFGLTNLEYLAIRGTDIKFIPCEISRLSRLTTLRIENCPVTALPLEMRELKRLKNLELSDTGVTAIDKEMLPEGLRKINIVGTLLSTQPNMLTDLNLKLGHVE